MDSTVLGLAVNLAKRLEEVTRSLGVDMLITDQVARKLPKGHGHRLRKLTEASLKGCSAPVGIIEVYDQDPPEVQHLKNQIEPLLEEGVKLFKGGHFEAALSRFQAAQGILPTGLTPSAFRCLNQGALDSGGRVEGTALLDFR